MPDPVAVPSVYLTDIFNQIGGNKGVYRGIAYDISTDNSYTLLSTPNLWGRDPADSSYIPTAQNLVQAIKDTVASAQTTVDISTLMPMPNGTFRQAIYDGLRAATDRGNEIIMRTLMGNPWAINDEESTKNLQEWVNYFSSLPRVTVYAGSMQAKYTSWNHSKLIIVDNRAAICGGHNYWQEAYCDFAPIHDVSILITGSAVCVAQEFLNWLWQMVGTRCRNKMDFPNRWLSVMQRGGQLYYQALPRIQTAAVPGSGTAKVLSLARMGDGIAPLTNSTNASRRARIRAVELARQSIKLSVQMLTYPFNGLVDEELLAALGAAVSRGVELFLVCSDAGAKDRKGADYGSTGIENESRSIKAAVRKCANRPEPQLNALLQEKVHVAPLYVSTFPNKWREGGDVVIPGNHAKVYIVDDVLFYVGSDNPYPSFIRMQELITRFPKVLEDPAILQNREGLPEFGFLIGGQEETGRFLREYWDRLWEYSGPHQFTNWEKI